MRDLAFPGGRKFAFTIIDDTDVGTVENLEPIYQLLDELGLRTTKTVWPMSCPEGSRNFSTSETLEDPRYRDFVLDLKRRGFEIASHGATMESSTRDRTVAGLERFNATFGGYPRVHANHARNRENLYWGVSRVDQPTVKFLLRRLSQTPPDYFLGQVEGTPYWWGDLSLRHLSYVRNLTFNEINLSRINPSMPYHDPSRPYVRWWFSAVDAEDCLAFNERLRPARLDRLESERGFSIVATHFGKSFVKNGRLDRLTKERLVSLARRPGWFPTVSELLDHLLSQRDDECLPRREWARMQWRWAWDLLVRKSRSVAWKSRRQAK